MVPRRIQRAVPVFRGPPSAPLKLIASCPRWPLRCRWRQRSAVESKSFLGSRSPNKTRRPGRGRLPGSPAASGMCAWEAARSFFPSSQRLPVSFRMMGSSRAESCNGLPVSCRRTPWSWPVAIRRQVCWPVNLAGSAGSACWYCSVPAPRRSSCCGRGWWILRGFTWRRGSTTRTTFWPQNPCWGPAIPCLNWRPGRKAWPWAQPFPRPQCSRCYALHCGWIGREVGSGARQCQDALLRDRPPPRKLAKDHRGVAEAIRCGWADVGVCVRLVCEEAGLTFIKVREEAYDLCLSTGFERDPRFCALFQVVRSLNFRNWLSALPGYDCRQGGEIVRID